MSGARRGSAEAWAGRRRGRGRGRAGRGPGPRSAAHAAGLAGRRRRRSPARSGARGSRGRGRPSLGGSERRNAAPGPSPGRGERRLRVATRPAAQSRPALRSRLGSAPEGGGERERPLWSQGPLALLPRGHAAAALLAGSRGGSSRASRGRRQNTALQPVSQLGSCSCQRRGGRARSLCRRFLRGFTCAPSSLYRKAGCWAPAGGRAPGPQRQGPWKGEDELGTAEGALLLPLPTRNYPSPVIPHSVRPTHFLGSLLHQMPPHSPPVTAVGHSVSLEAGTRPAGVKPYRIL